IYIGTAPKEVKTCLEILKKELVKLQEKGISEQALAILKDNLKGAVLINSDSVESRMTAIAKSEMFFGKYFSTQDICKLIDRVTHKDVQGLARTLFRPQNRLGLVLGD